MVGRIVEHSAMTRFWGVRHSTLGLDPVPMSRCRAVSWDARSRVKGLDIVFLGKAALKPSSIWMQIVVASRIPVRALTLQNLL